MMKQVINTLKFSESGVRGVVGDGLTPQLVAALAAAFGKYIGGGKVVVGRDTRPTGNLLEDAVVAGLLAVGCQAVRLGVVPTPTVQIMTVQLGAGGGIAITASHNPTDWNALKFVDSGGTFLDRTAAGELFDIYSQGTPEYLPEALLREIVDYPNAFAVHEKKIFAAGVDIEAIRKARLKVAVDCCNGVGAVYSVNFLKALGCEVIALHDVPSGLFERTPEPVPEALGPLAAAVRREGCAVGFAQDPDGDRLTIVDNQGNILSPHLTVALAVEHILGAYESAVAVNIQTTRAVEDIVKSYGGEIFYSKVGEINVVEEMREHHAEIGGEGNCGGVIWSRVHCGRDSFVAMTLILEMLSLTDETLAEIVDSLPHYYNLNTRFPASPLQAREVIELLAKRYERYQPRTFDGLRIDFENGWVLVRSSNTERILRLNVESRTPVAAQELLDRFSAEIAELIGGKTTIRETK